jgi:hypothetical protein
VPNPTDDPLAADADQPIIGKQGAIARGSSSRPTHTQQMNLGLRGLRGRRGGYRSKVLDVRCSSAIHLLADEGRCQLYVGHEGEHALLLCIRERVLRRWLGAETIDLPFGTEIPIQLAWAPGFPRVVELPANLSTVLNARPRHLRSVA